MKKFDLTTLKIQNLSKSELVELDIYLDSLNYREIISFLVKVMDNLSLDSKDCKKVEDFIRTSKHSILIHEFTIIADHMLIEEYTEEDWLALEKKTKVIRYYLHKENIRKRKDKLFKINQL